MEEGPPTIPRASDVETPNVDPLQAGPSIAGPPEAGRVEAGHLDAGPIENGPTEAGPAEAGTSSIAPKNNQILDCPVCYSLYDHETHVPKVLRCGHTVCLECLRQIRAMRQNVLRCPSCRKDHAFDDPVEVLPNNFAVLRVLDALCIQCKQQICEDEHLKICKTCLPNFIQKTTRELNESVQKFDDAIVKLSCDFDKDRQAELILDKQNSLENVCKELFKAYRDLLHIREREIIDQIKSASETDLKEIDKFHATLRLDIASITTKLDELKIGLSTAGSITDGIQTKHLLSLSSEIQEVLGKAKAWPESTIQDSRVHLCERFLHYIEKYTDISSPCVFCSDRHMMNSICHISNERMWYGNASVLQHFDNDTFGHEVFDEPLDVAVSPVDGTLIVVNNRSRRLVFFDQIDYDEGAYITKHQYEFSKVVEEFGEEGSQFTGVDFDNDGNICLTDNQHNCIWIYKTNGDRVNRFDATGQFHDPAGIAVDPDSGNMHVVDLEKIQVLSPNGLIVREFLFPEELRTSPLSVAVKHHKIYILGDDSRIYIHDMNFEQLDVQVTDGRAGESIAIDASGNILTCDIYPQVFFQNPKSNIALLLGGNEAGEERYKFESAISMAVNKDGDIIVCDFRSNNLKVLSCLYH